MDKVTKTELVEMMYAKLESLNLSRSTISSIHDVLVEAIVEALMASKSVTVHGLCTLTPRSVAAKTGVSPNGAQWSKPAQTGVKVSVSSTLKKTLNAK